MKTLLKSFILAIALTGQIFAQDLYFPSDTFTIETKQGLKDVFVGGTNEEGEEGSINSLYYHIYEKLRDNLADESYAEDFRNPINYVDGSYSGSVNLYTTITNLNRLWKALDIYTEPTDANNPAADSAGMLLQTSSKGTVPFTGYTEPVAQYVGYTFQQNNRRIVNTGTDGAFGHMTFTGTGSATSETCAPPNGEGSKCFKFNSPAEKAGPNCAISIDPEYSPLVGATNFTIMAWVYRNDISDTQAGGGQTAARIVSDTPGSNGERGFDLRFSGSDGRIQLRIGKNETGYVDCEFSKASENVPTIAPTDKEWKHITVVYNGTTTAYLYITKVVDGELTVLNDGTPYTATMSGASKLTNKMNAVSFYIGNSGGNNTTYGNYVGYIDDVMLFKNWVPKNADEVLTWASMDDTSIANPYSQYDGQPLGEMNPDLRIYTKDEVDNKMMDNSIGHYVPLDTDNTESWTAITHGERDYGFGSGIYSINIGSGVKKPVSGINTGDNIWVKRRDYRTTGTYNTAPTVATTYNPDGNNIITVSGTTYGPFKVGDSLAIFTSNPASATDENPPSPSADGIDGTVTKVDANGKLKEFVIGARSMAAAGNHSTAIGNSCVAMGDFSIAIGGYSGAFGYMSVAEGDNCFSYNTNSIARGRYSTAKGAYSRAEGDHCYAIGSDSIAMGAYSVASNDYSITMGLRAKATNDNSFVWNCSNNTYYGSHGDGTFSINPNGCADGFYVGGTNLTDHIRNIGKSVTEVTYEYPEDIDTDTDIMVGALAVTGNPEGDNYYEIFVPKNLSEYDNTSTKFSKNVSWTESSSYDQNSWTKIGRLSYNNVDTPNVTGADIYAPDGKITITNSLYGYTNGYTKTSSSNPIFKIPMPAHPIEFYNRNATPENNSKYDNSTEYAAIALWHVKEAYSPDHPSSDNIYTEANKPGLYSVSFSQDSAGHPQKNYATGFGSFAHGRDTRAEGEFSHAEGYDTKIVKTGITGISGEEGYVGQASHVDGVKAMSTNRYAYVWSGINGSQYYSSHGMGTYNINPTNGPDGFYIGEKSLSQCISEANRSSRSRSYTRRPDLTTDSADIDLDNGTVQSFEQPGEGNSEITLYLPEITEDREDDAIELMIYIDRRDPTKESFTFDDEFINSHSLPLNELWENDNESAVWKIYWISPPFDRTWHYGGYDKFLADSNE